MLLCDQIVTWASVPFGGRRRGFDWSLAHPTVYEDQTRAFRDLSRRLSGSVRYVLADDVVTMSTDVLLSRPSSLQDVLGVLRIPYPSLWIEWNDDARRAARLHRDIVKDNGKDVPARLGFLVETDAEGRRGTATFCWSHERPRTGPQPPAVCPYQIRFDFDAPPDAPIPETDRMRIDSYRRWQGHARELAALDAISGIADLSLSDDGRRSLMTMATVTGAPEVARVLLASARDDLAGETLQIVSILMLLAARNGIERTPEDRTQLNRARRKRGEPELLSHVVATMRLSKGERRSLATGGGAGVSPRAHIVRGHYCVRGRTIYWRRSHVRAGQGGPPPAQRTVHVRV